MEKEILDNGNLRITIEREDLESAIRAFVVDMEPQYERTHSIEVNIPGYTLLPWCIVKPNDSPSYIIP